MRILLIAGLLLMPILGLSQEVPRTVKKEDFNAYNLKRIADADWVAMEKDSDHNDVFIDKKTIYRMDAVVFFNVKFSRHGTDIFVMVTGSCLNDNVVQSNGFALYPSAKTPVRIELEHENEIKTLSPATIGYIMLDYSCKNGQIVGLAPKTP
jgi:hypothetical protein